jgi:hypothetical protein
MATIAKPVPSALQKERAFFFYMALALLGITVIGFVRFFFLGLSSLDSPWWVHLHGVSMMGWLLLYVAQSGLVAQGNVALHRQLGILTAGFSVWVLAVGIGVLVFNTMEHRTPPFFPGAYMHALDGLTVIAFCALTWAAIALRNRSDWHKRLMLGGTILLIQPGLGRLLPVPLIDTGISYLLFPGHLLFFAVAIFYDWRTRGRVHPAYYWGLGALGLTTVLPVYVAQMRPLIDLVDTLKG